MSVVTAAALEKVPDPVGPLTPSALASPAPDNAPHIDRRLLQAGTTDAARRRQARSWAALIQRVWEVDPLKCPECGGQMQVVRFPDESGLNSIEARQKEVIRRILEHCGLWQGPPRQLPQPRPPPARQRPSPPREVQLVLDAEFAQETATSGSSPPERHLVLDPQYLAECHGEAEAQQAVVLYD